LVLRFPENLIYRFNLCALLYEYAFDTTKQSSRNIEQTKEAIKYSKIILPILQHLCHNHHSRTTRLNLETAPENKKRKENLFDNMAVLADQKYYFLIANSEQFENKLREDEENEKKRNVVIEEKKKLRERMEQEKLNKEKEALQKEKEREAEERAMKYLEMAQNDEMVKKKESEDEGKDSRKKKKKKNIPIFTPFTTFNLIT